MRDDLPFAAALLDVHGVVEPGRLSVSHDDLAVLDRFKAAVGFGRVHRLRKRWVSESAAEAEAVLEMLRPLLVGAQEPS